VEANCTFYYFSLLFQLTPHVIQLFDTVKRSQHPLGSPAHLSNFVIKTLFDSLISAVPLKDSDSVVADSALMIWFETYR
jgi:hypothetical protein